LNLVTPHGDNVNHDELEAMFAFICKQHRETSYPPSLRELGETFYMSAASILRYLDRMEALGWITREPGRARGITLVRECEETEE
jgi:DNA-binding MarR family transcriptional regulator